MSKKLFSSKDIEILSKNKYVKKVSEKGITYTDEFKRLFIAENEKGKFPRDIFEECGFNILKSLGFRKGGIRIVSCPTCGRTRIDLLNLVTQAENRLGNIDKDITVAIMGCAVNGPGEAREADIGIAGGKGEGLIFKHGQILRKVPEDRLLEELILEVEKI